MKFDKVIPKEPWPIDKTQERIAVIFKEIAEINRKMNSIDGVVNHCKSTKDALRKRAANKWKYLKQLQLQAKEQGYEAKDNYRIN